MSARQLPLHPSLEQYKKQAKELLERCKSGDAEAQRRVKKAATYRLADAQFAIAREHGFASWPEFARHIAAQTGEPSHAAVWRMAEQAIVAGDAARLERLLGDHGDVFRKGPPRSSWFGGLADDYSPIYRLPVRTTHPGARAIIAEAHHFASWAQYAAMAAALDDPASSIAQFEAAADAIVAGDVAELERRLRRDRGLISARSTRTHRSTLLHYVGANGVESFRQKTPANAVRIAEALLDAGADVEAMADMYGGATKLGLVATSIHPQRAGLQNALIYLLLAHGATIDHPGAAGNGQGLVNGCLANGRDEAAEFLASRGASLDLAGAAGIGRLDVVRTFFDDGGTLKPTATQAQLLEGFGWACAYGRTNVVEYLLGHGVGISARLPGHGQTGLHSAAYEGHLDTIDALLKRGAALDAVDDRWHSTPLAWAFTRWYRDAPDRHYDVVAALVAAGSVVKPEWFEDERVRADARMQDALRGVAGGRRD